MERQWLKLRVNLEVIMNEPSLLIEAFAIIGLCNTLIWFINLCDDYNVGKAMSGKRNRKPMARRYTGTEKGLNSWRRMMAAKYSA